MPDACLGHRVPFTYSFIPRRQLQASPLQKPPSLKDAHVFCTLHPGLARLRRHFCVYPFIGATKGHRPKARR